MELESLMLKETLDSLPPEWPEDLLPSIKDLFQASNAKLVVLDDDPTGNQTVFNIPVLTQWSVDLLRAELENDIPAFFILTNSRSLPAAEAEEIGCEIGRKLAEASSLSERSIAVVSRGDSTLRGHFPGEVFSLQQGLGIDFDAWLLMPALIGAGRYTLNDIHYVVEGDWLVPAGNSVYAQDGTFGYQSSNLRSWVEEKSGGRILAENVASISIEDIRHGGPQKILQILMNLPHGSVIIANAVSRRDFEVVVKGLLLAEATGRRYIYRTTATFLPIRFGLAPYPFLQPQDLNLPSAGGGLIVVGSYVPKTSQQMKILFEREPITKLEVNVNNILDQHNNLAEIKSIASQADHALEQGQDTVIYTSRDLVLTNDPERNLEIGRLVSSGLIEILKQIQARPRYLLAKGGITSHDVATKGMGVQRAMVLGQLCQGISVWQFGPETRYKDLAYVVFPGNVGTAETLADVVRRLRNPQAPC
jgi:uncharacterized protein YgbK (DUF1537 family)